MNRAATALKMRAFALVMAAKAGTDTSDDVNELRGACLRYAGYGDELSRHVDAFCDALAEAAPADWDARSKAASEMLRWIDHHNRPIPPGSDRRDLHG